MEYEAQGSAHGRFQPLHKGHVEYLLAAKANCEFLWVGITQPNIRELVDVPGNLPGDLHRLKPENNPLTYFERCELVRVALCAEGIAESEFSTIPFPIEKPHHLQDFLPPAISIYTTICEEWNRGKIRLLQDQGYNVVTLWERTQKKYEGIRIRRMMVNGDDSWTSEVPKSTVELLRAFNLPRRLVQLAEA